MRDKTIAFKRQVLLVIMLIALTLKSPGQHYRKCKVFQYVGTDSLHPVLVSEQTYNAKGLLQTWYYHGYKESLVCGINDISYVNKYRDTFLVGTRSVCETTKDRTKVIFTYNRSGQKVKQEFFDYKKRIRKGVDKGLGRPGGCVVFDGDFEQKRTWQSCGELSFKYDSLGRKVRVDNWDYYPYEHKHIWTYDPEGRLLTDTTFEGFVHISSVDEYSYAPGRYQYIRTWYDYDRKPKLTDEFWRRYIRTYKLDDSGNVIEETTATENSNELSRLIRDYDTTGKLLQDINYDTAGQREVTHIYYYE